MIPILYNETETQFLSNGLGHLSEAMTCVVTEERNGMFELEMTYPISGKRFNDISEGKIIYAVPSDGEEPEPFDIYKITTPISGYITIYARHISYRTSYIPVLPFTATGPVSSAQAIAGGAVYVIGARSFSITASGFEGNEPGVLKIDNPISIREAIGSSDNSFLSIFKGEVKWKKFDITLYKNRGVNKNIQIVYSKNLIDIEQEATNENLIAGVLPFYKTDTGCIYATENENESKIIYLSEALEEGSEIQNGYSRIIPLDLADAFEQTPTESQVKAQAEEYLIKNYKNISTLTLKVSFIPLWQTEEYRNIAPLQRVNLCDLVTVSYPALGIMATKKVILTKYDTLSDKYMQIELGDDTNQDDKKNTTLAQKISNLSYKVDTSNKKVKESLVTYIGSTLEESLENQATKILGGSGGYVHILQDGDGKPREILITNTEAIESSTQCMKINQNGIGFVNIPETGNAGDIDNVHYFTSAWTIDGQFDGQCIKSRTIKAESIEVDRSLIGKLSDNYIEAKVVQTESGVTKPILSIGKANNFKIVINDEKMSLQDSFGKELAKLQYNQLVADNIDIGDGFRLTNDSDGFIISALGGE